MNDVAASGPTPPLPQPAEGKARRRPILTAVLAVVGLGLLILAIVMATRSDDGKSASIRRSEKSKGQTRTSPSTKTESANAGASSTSSVSSTTSASAATTSTTSSTGPSIAYLTAPTSIVCDPNETARAVDVTLRAERVTEVAISGDEQASQELVATATDPTIVGTVRMIARCSTTNDFVVKATGTDGSTVERHVTVVARVRPPIVGS